MNEVQQNNISTLKQNINSAFGHLLFYRVKDDAMYSVFAALIQSFLGDGFKYVMLVVPRVHVQEDKKTCSLFEIPWVCLQTRSLSTRYNISDQAIDPRSMDPRYLPEYNRLKLVVKNRTSSSTYYTSYDTSIEVTLLSDPKKKSIYQYPDALDVMQALNTFQCILKINGISSQLQIVE